MTHKILLRDYCSIRFFDVFQLKNTLFYSHTCSMFLFFSCDWCLKMKNSLQNIGWMISSITLWLLSLSLLLSVAIIRVLLLMCFEHFLKLFFFLTFHIYIQFIELLKLKHFLSIEISKCLLFIISMMKSLLAICLSIK